MQHEWFEVNDVPTGRTDTRMVGVSRDGAGFGSLLMTHYGVVFFPPWKKEGHLLPWQDFARLAQAEGESITKDDAEYAPRGGPFTKLAQLADEPMKFLGEDD